MRLSKQCSARVIRWETMGLLVGYGSLLLGLRGNAQDSHLYLEGLRRGGFVLSGDNAEFSVLWQRSRWSSWVGAIQGCQAGAS